MTKVLKTLLQLETAAIAGMLMAAMVVPAAYAQRGYDAVGGEWILVMLAAWAGWQIGKEFMK